MPVQDLILLVGTNPLPPYVVACFFLEAAATALPTVWLLYSESGPQQMSTLPQAQQIAAGLQQRFGAEVCLHPIRDISAAPAIQADVAALCERLGPAEQAHFNYSGGTKAMALHSYRTLEQTLGARVSFSYLDGRRFCLVSDASGQALNAQDLRRCVQLNFKEWIQLNQFALYRPFAQAVMPELQPALLQLQQLLQTEGGLQAFWGTQEAADGWFYLREPLMQAAASVHDISRSKYQKLYRRGLRQQAEALARKRQGFYAGEAFEQVLAAFPPDWQAAWRALDPALLDENGLAALYHISRFCDGQWLEMHTFSVLQQVLAERFAAADLCMGLELRQQNWDTYFEVDIAALIGYQLLGVSCTTYNRKSACKNKGFEIIHRVRQIGGDEVREGLKMLLVTCVAPVERERLQQELAVETGTRRANILVCGQADLAPARLSEQIRQFLT